MNGGTIIRLRAACLGVLLGLGICAFTPYNNTFLNATPLAGGHFPLAPFFILVWLAVGCALWNRFRPGRPLLTGPEMFIVWMLMAVVSGIGYTGLARSFLIILTAPSYFATAGNRWHETLGPLMPDGLFPNDPSAVAGLYEGLPDGRSMGWLEVLGAIPWPAWLGPLAAWGVFILLSYAVMLCLANLFSRQWIESERMNFPLLRAPRELALSVDGPEGLGGFLVDRYLLTGLLLTVFLHTINGLAFYIPTVPQIPTLLLAGKYFSKTGLLSGFQKLKVYILPAFVGFAFLTSRQISLSLWLFFLLGGLSSGFLAVVGLQIPASALGPAFGPALNSPEETQMIGAYGVFFLFILWLARFHLVETARLAFTGQGRGVGPREPEWFGPRAGACGAIFGFAAMAAWMIWFGVGPVATVLVLGSFFLVALTASRVICQGGIAYFTLTAAPLDGFLGLFGTTFLHGTGLLVSAAAQKTLFVDLRESLLPSLVHAYKAGEGVRNRRLLLLAVAVALVAGVIVSLAAMLAVSYKYGVRELHTEWAVASTTSLYESVRSLVETPSGPHPWTVAFSAAGGVIMLGLILCYQRFHWWPIHPIGYLAAYSSAMSILWFSFVIGWLANHLVLRYGGVGLFSRVRRFFIGLIVGDFLMGGIWAVYGFYAGSSYQVLPG